MSFHALAWAVASQPGSAADKLVLLGLADRHNTEHDAAYPSIDWIVDFSGLDRKTVIAALARLIGNGLIEDTGQRVGRTKQVKVYRLSIPKTEQYQKRNSSVIPSKESQKRDTDTIKEPKASRTKVLSASRAKTELHEAAFDENAAVLWAISKMDWTHRNSEQELQRFFDNAVAHSRKYVDWMAAWRNWCRSPFQKTVGGDQATAYRQEPMRV